MDITNFIPMFIELAILIPLSGLLLMISSRLFKTKDDRYSTAIRVTAIVYVIQRVLLIGLTYLPYYSDQIDRIITVTLFIIVAAVGYFFVKRTYTLSYQESGKVFAVWYAFDIILNFAWIYFALPIIYSFF